MNNKQHVQLPNGMAHINDIEPKDQLIYCAIKRHGTTNCWPSLKCISNESGASINTIRKSIKKLVDAGYITIKPHGKKGQQYLFNPYKYFEPFSYDFLDRKDLSFTAKSYLVASQQFMYTDVEGKGKISYTNSQLSDKINMPESTIRDCNRELLNKHYLTLIKNECINPDTGCKTDTKIFELNSLGQAVVWTLVKHERAIQETQENVEKLKDKCDKLETLLNATLKQLNSQQAKPINVKFDLND